MSNEQNEMAALEQDDDALDDEQQAEAPPEDFGHGIPVSVEETGRVFNDFKERFGEDQAALLQSKWGDKALHNEAIVRAVIEDSPRFDELYVAHQTDDGGISREGMDLIVAEIAKTAGFEDQNALLKNHPEIDAIITENSNERSLSPVGLHQVLAYIGQRSGYNFTHRGQRT